MNKPTISFQTDRLRIRSITEADKDYYMDLRISSSDIKKAYEILQEFRQEEWENELNSDDDIYMAVFLKEDETFVASCSLQHYLREEVDIGFDVVEEYRNQGIATELVEGLIDIAKSELEAKSIFIKTRKDNNACKRVAEKCGGKLTSYEPAWAAQVMEKLAEIMKDNKTSDEEWDQDNQDTLEIIEDEKLGVCVYQIDIRQ